MKGKINKKKLFADYFIKGRKDLWVSMGSPKSLEAHYEQAWLKATFHQINRRNI